MKRARVCSCLDPLGAYLWASLDAEGKFLYLSMKSISPATFSHVSMKRLLHPNKPTPKKWIDLLLVVDVAFKSRWFQSFKSILCDSLYTAIL